VYRISIIVQGANFKKKNKKMKKDHIESLFKHSILQREQRAQQRAMERKKLEQTKPPNDPLIFSSCQCTKQQQQKCHMRLSIL
jgi:uncharacterized protein YqgQ